ncbi:MAG TPA: cation:proton antiporter, partial [Actinomycetota bacterium]|nr:cation:proton antiporter [Actinomycetota bacterium]
MEVGHVLVDILVVLVVAKCAAEISLRIGAPTVAGELVAGILIGPSLLGWVEESAALAILAELGVLLLLVEVGMQMEIGDL